MKKIILLHIFYCTSIMLNVYAVLWAAVRIKIK